MTRHSKSLSWFVVGAFDTLKKRIIHLFERGFLDYDQDTKTFVATKKGSRQLTVNMFKPNEEPLLAIKESIPFQKAIKSVKVKDSGDDYVLTSSAKKKH